MSKLSKWLAIAAVTCSILWLTNTLPISAQELHSQSAKQTNSATATFKPPEYVALRAAEPPKIDGILDEPAWFVAPSISQFQFPWFQQGKREQSAVKLLWDDQNLYVAHICQDEFITARHSERDGPISQDDCFEIMLAPRADQPNFYFNIEWNAIRGYLDNHRPGGATGPRVAWNSTGVRIACTLVGTANNHADRDTGWIGEVAIPFTNFVRSEESHFPRAGNIWHANFNRHGGEQNVQYSQWSAGDTPQPSFHTPHRFGRIVFSQDTSPFPTN